MTALVVLAVTLVGVTGTVVVLTGAPDRQAIGLSVFAWLSRCCS